MDACASPEGTVVLFDGVCNLCNGVVNFLIDHDPAARLRFATLQSETGRRLLLRHGLPVDARDTLVLIDSGAAFTRSTAALRVAGQLPPPWRWLVVLRLVPRGLRDRLYDSLARRRYRWFGRCERCRVPEPGVLERFL